MKYALVGYGKMGKAIERLAAQRGHELAGIIDPQAGDQSRATRIERLEKVEVAFEFSRPDTAKANLLALLHADISVVCGTTGWCGGEELQAALRTSRAGAVIAPNFSVGMNLFYRLVRQAGRLFGSTGLHEPFLLEEHHRAKLDLPSGTARHLASLLVEADPRLESIQIGNPAGGPLPREKLHVASLRAGAEAGTHTVGYDGDYDRITLRHSSRGRDGFALGALLAAEWVVGKPGLHAFDEVLEDLLPRSYRS